MIYIISVLIFFVKGSVSMTKINYDESTDMKFPILYNLSISTTEQTKFENVDKLFVNGMMVWNYYILKRNLNIVFRYTYHLNYENHRDLSYIIMPCFVVLKR